MDTFLLVAMAIGLAIAFLLIWRQLHDLHLSTNSRLDQLLKTTGELARERGFKAGQENHLSALRDAGSKLDPGKS